MHVSMQVSASAPSLSPPIRSAIQPAVTSHVPLPLFCLFSSSYHLVTHCCRCISRFSSSYDMDRDEEGVEDSELPVKVSNDGLVYHVYDLPNPQAELDQLRVEEIWRQEDATGGRLLGRGGFGAVYKEKCIHDIRGSKLGRFRAVKVIERGDEVTKAYYREELKALVKFSAPKVGLCAWKRYLKSALTDRDASVSFLVCRVLWVVRGHGQGVYQHGTP